MSGQSTLPLFTEGFNPVMFMYLNPTICLASNISSVEKATGYWNSLSAIQQSNIFINIDHVPSALDPVVFLGDNKHKFDIGQINADIKSALSNQGIFVRGTFNVPTLFVDVDSLGANKFGRSRTTGEQLTTITGPYGVYAGDYIKLVSKETGATRYACVTSIDLANDTFQVGNGCTHPFAQGTYRLYGIALYDPLRLARIAYLRLFAAANANVNVTDVPSEQPSIPVHPIVNVNVDSNFNYELYRVLYPDAQTLDKDAAYLDYVGNVDRIKNLTDLKMVLNESATQSFNNVTIGQTLTLNFDQESARLKWNGLELYYVTKDSTRPLINVSPYYHGFITEYAIKKYVRDQYWPVASFCNIVAEGNVTIDGAVYAPAMSTSNLDVAENVTTGTLTVNNDATFFGSVAVSDNVMSGRICIGNVQEAALSAPPENIITDTLSVEHAFVNQSLYVGGGGATVTGVIHAHDASFSEIKGFKFGLGPTPDDYVSQLGPTPNIPSLMITSNLMASSMVAPIATISNLAVPILLVASNLVVTSGRIDITDIYASRTFAGHATCGVARCSNIYIADFVRVGGTVTSTALTAIGMTGSNFACSNMECTGAGTFKASLEVGEPVVATADSQRATLLVQGCVQANNVDDIADMCVMRNVQPATATPTFSNLILDAPIHSFKLNHDLSRTRHGYLASEIETICPEAVYTTTDYTSMIMSNVAQIADNLIELPSAMNVRVGDYVIIANGRRVPVVAATATSASTSTSTVRIAAVDAAAAAAGGSLAGQTTVFIEGIVYNTVKCIDYHQVIMSLCAAVKQLATR